MTLSYRAFLEAKTCVASRRGFAISLDEVHGRAKAFQAAVIRWMVAGGQRACFASFGLGKTLIDLETVRLTRQRAGGRALIMMPLGVRQEFFQEAALLGIPVTFIRESAEATDPDGIYLTNYESVREGKLDAALFSVVGMDEADVLRTFGSKTFSEVVIAGGWHQVPYRYLFSATPDPNDYLELLGYSQFLGVMDIGQGKTRFFKRDSEKADALTLYRHKESEFWHWVATWALVFTKPSDLGEYSDEGYALPAMAIHWHELASDHAAAGAEKSGQGRIFASAAHGVTDAAREKRSSLPARIAKLLELRAEDPEARRLIWHTLEAEREAIEDACPGAVAVYGTQDLDEREAAVQAFSRGEIQELAAKPVIAGAGCNFQRHCAWAVFLGIDYRFRDLIQAIHRIYRFLQTSPVRIDLIYTEAERPVRAELEAKWGRYERQVERLSQLVRQYGLAKVADAGALQRSIGVVRAEVGGARYRLINADAVEESAALPADSVDLIVTSIPFSTQYEYTPSFNDFGHTDSAEHFWAQMDYLSPELLRVLRPGRVALIHVKDRVQPGAMTGLGFQTVQPFHAEALVHYRRHGFAFLGMKTVVTDVVRENAQTYRLGYTEQCKDGSRMGAGMPEYLLVLRKPPTDASNGYADVPVVKNKAEYSRARWQVDAHGFQRSSGDRLMTPEEIASLPYDVVFNLFRQFSARAVYDFERDVALGEALLARRRLPPDFMLLQPVSWHPDVWTDITRMRTMNTFQAAHDREKHICPLPFDIVDRAITQYSMPGELVFDPFAGLGTVPYRAVKLNRRGLGIELNTGYFLDSGAYCRAAEEEIAMPGLFDAVATGQWDEPVAVPA